MSKLSDNYPIFKEEYSCTFSCTVEFAKPKMMDFEQIVVREMTKEDIGLITDYWLNSDSEYLKSLGVDLFKLPSRNGLKQMLFEQIQLPYKQKSSLAMIAEMKGVPSGHCNVNQIAYGHSAAMHLHIWNAHDRRKGVGTHMVQQSIPVFFERLRLQYIWCEPYALNQAPNRTLEKAGFQFVKKYRTIPGSLNFEQEVNRYELTIEKFNNY